MFEFLLTSVIVDVLCAAQPHFAAHTLSATVDRDNVSLCVYICALIIIRPVSCVRSPDPFIVNLNLNTSRLESTNIS